MCYFGEFFRANGTEGLLFVPALVFPGGYYSALGTGGDCSRSLFQAIGASRDSLPTVPGMHSMRAAAIAALSHLHRPGLHSGGTRPLTLG